MTNAREDHITIEEDGWATFPVNGGSVSVWALPELDIEHTEDNEDDSCVAVPEGEELEANVVTDHDHHESHDNEPANS